MKNPKPDLAYDYIRKRILSGEYPAGHPLLTEQLSEAIGVSRTPVGEALLKLQADGLVTIKPRLGASVRALDLNEFCELCDMRLALESHAAGRAAAHRTEAELTEIEQALENMRAMAEEVMANEDAAARAEIQQRLNWEDIWFHLAIMSAAKNEIMKKEILRLHLINRVLAGPSMMSLPQLSKAESDANQRLVMASHQQIFDAILKRDAQAAKAAMEGHIEDIVKKSIARIRPKAEVASRRLSPEELAYFG